MFPRCLVRPGANLRHLTRRPRLHADSCKPSLVSQPRDASSRQPFSSSTRRSHSSVDPTEVSHFNDLAGSWWDPHGSSRLLHLMNPLRHTFIQQCLAAGPRPSSVAKLSFLDIGCGGGIFAESAARLSNTKSVLAIDASPEVLKVANAHKRRDPTLCEPGRLTYKNIPVEKLAQEEVGDQLFDVVTVFEVIEHVTNPSAFLEQVSKHIKPGGWLIMSTIARTWTSWAVTKVIAEDIVGIVPPGTHDWDKYINEHELRSWFESRPGWQQAQSQGVLYVPGFGWREVQGGEKYGNYFFGVQKTA